MCLAQVLNIESCMFRIIFTLLVVLVIGTDAIYAQANPTATLPSDTDSRITSFNDANYSWLPVGRSRNQLLLFLQGTNGVPRPQFPFLDTAAELGYYVIELSYPNNVAAQQACINSPDPDAYIKFRLEIIEGGNLSELIDVSTVDSIENRLQKLLRCLDNRQMKRGWGQFLDRNGQINWENIAVAGQSQGGGHAYVISKYHQVARVIMTGSPKDYSHYFNKPAKGFDSSTKTPLDRYFAFNHFEDRIGACNYTQQMEILQQMGLTRYGIADADRTASNYNHAHIIVTNVELGNNPKQYHGAALNAAIVSSPPVWRYMLTEPVQ